MRTTTVVIPLTLRLLLHPPPSPPGALQDMLQRRQFYNSRAPIQYVQTIYCVGNVYYATVVTERLVNKSQIATGVPEFSHLFLKATVFNNYISKSHVSLEVEKNILPSGCHFNRGSHSNWRYLCHF